jgi:AmmeMemoRadiSam system protein B
VHTITDIRPSPIAGQWYLSDPKRLADLIDRYLTEAKLPELTGEVVAVMAPHAGHRYSGAVAGYAFATLRGLQPELVAVISPMHYPYPQELLTTTHSAYGTPLGEITVDREALQAIDDGMKQALGFGLTGVQRDSEHSVEIELPFLQRVLVNEFRLIPIMVREQSLLVTQTLGKALAETLKGQRAILVASTDLSHFYPQTVADQLDAEVLRCVEALDPEGVLMAEEQGKGFACGRGALAAVLWAAKELGADTVKVLKHATSGDVTGDLTQVVGYGAAVMLRSQKESGNQAL